MTGGQYLLQVRPSGELSSPAPAAGTRHSAAWTAVNANHTQHRKTPLFSRCHICLHLSENRLQNFSAMLPEKRIVKLLLCMSPPTWSIKGKFRTRQLNQLNSLFNCLYHKLQPGLFLLFPGIPVPYHLGGCVQNTMTDKQYLLHTIYPHLWLFFAPAFDYSDL